MWTSTHDEAFKEVKSSQVSGVTYCVRRLRGTTDQRERNSRLKGSEGQY